MKRDASKAKLRLHTATVRVLTATELAAPAGGLPTDLCNGVWDTIGAKSSKCP